LSERSKGDRFFSRLLEGQELGAGGILEIGSSCWMQVDEPIRSLAAEMFRRSRIALVRVHAGVGPLHA
jgi:hypothetical protein